MTGKSDYSDEFKRRALIAFRNRGNRSAEDVAREFGVSAGSIYYWMKNEPHTPAAKLPATTVTLPGDQYSQEFKRQAVAAFNNRGNRRTDEIAESLGVARSQLYRWRDQGFGNGSGSTHEEPNDRTGYAPQRRRTPLSVAPNLDEESERKPSATQAAAENRQLAALRVEHERLAAEAAALRKTIVVLGRGH